MNVEKPDPRVTLDNFVLLTMIGKGSYAKVVLVKRKVIGLYIFRKRKRCLL